MVFYLPREFIATIILAVYICIIPSIEALHELYNAIGGRQTAHPDSFFTVAETLTKPTYKL